MPLGKDATYKVSLGRLLEDVAGMHLKREFITPGIGNVSYDPRDGGADFIVQIANERQIVIEIGIGDKSNKQTAQTLQRISGNYGITICDTELGHMEGQKIIRLPINYFLLM